ncbi:hypothetical protein PGT21_012763 [Puccinia graminis f. sp. tritici]|uniref:Afadin and alpha-actinin-binding-domain-containing protein n=1 Tax=Puccinia graminis f. sp. tritici TaxID=56615 RepID=A0A5B0LM19_PUCGR|nr:hypothetical protein PGTUg99_001107 [Puccinia graminis f. sp. tritici]KAA1090758.1 hypothetical protein PGT21_012763 [Puccinia graminis f. sp. tritici]
MSASPSPAQQFFTKQPPHSMLQPEQQSNHPHQASSSSALHHDADARHDTHSEELAQLSTQLISAGFLRQPLPPDTLNGGSLEGQKYLIKAIWSMIASRSKEMSIREGLLAKQRELSYEHTRLEGFLERAEKEKLEAQQEATASTNRANAAQKELDLEKARHRKTRDDYSKLKNAERLIKTTSVHELRKKTNELDELQRRLTKLSSSKDLPLPSSLNWTSSAPLATRVDTGGGGRVGLLEFDLKASRDQNNQLQIDNSRLREYLGIYEQQLIDLISEITNHSDAQGSVFEIDDEEPMHEEDRFISTPNSNVPLPKIYKRLSLVTYKLRERVLEIIKLVEELQNKLTEISSLAEQERSKSQKELAQMRTNFEKEVERLKVSLKEAEATVEGWAHTGLAWGPPQATGMEDVTVERSLEIAQPQIQMQVEALSVERKTLAQEAIELARQRAEMEMRKMNEEREKILKELDMNPTPKQSISISTSQNAGDQTRPADEKGNETLESLVVYTKPKGPTTKALQTRTGKPRSSISKGLGTVHRVKQQIPSSATSISKPAPTRNRTAVLKSLLSITGEDGGISGSSTATNSSATASKPSLPHRTLNPSVGPSSSSSSSASRLRSESTVQRKFNLGKSHSRITRPPR